jgi:hypothetical protein
MSGGVPVVMQNVLKRGMIRGVTRWRVRECTRSGQERESACFAGALEQKRVQKTLS